MKIDLERSLIFDTISFFDVYFNYNYIVNKIESFNINIDNALKYYNIIIEKCSVDDKLYTFFYNENNFISFLMKIYLDNVDEIKCIDDLYVILKDKDFIKRQFLIYYFDSELSLADSMKELYKLDIEQNAKINLAFIISNFAFFLEDLILSIKPIYNLIKELFLTNLNKVKSYRLESKHIKILVEKYKDDVLLNAICSVSLIRPYIYRFSYIKKHNTYYWFFGYSCNIIIEQNKEYLNINYGSVGSLLSNSSAIDILNIIKDNLEITPTEISNLMENQNISRSTTYRLLNYLLSEKAIYVTKKTNQNVYYSINKEYFNHVLKIVDNKEIHKYMNFINSILLPNEDYKKIIELFSNDYVLPILNIIKAYKQINSSKIIEIISDKYNCANSTIYRILTLLLDNGVIYVSKRVSNKVFYSINEAFFVQAEQEMANLFHFYIDK